MRIIWFVSSLEQKGGGERFVLESVNELRAQGREVELVCDRLSSVASFNGKYELSKIICLGNNCDQKSAYISKAFNKFLGTIKLGCVIFSYQPDLIICQSDYDSIKIYLLSKIFRFKYRSFVFGQMYQFTSDISRYSLVFRKHLNKIIDSCPGYRMTVQMPPPTLKISVQIINEIVSWLKYRSIRNADRVFTLSSRVRWEVETLYGVDALVCRAAFSKSYINADRIINPRPISGPLRLLSVCRLVEKKRVDIIIKSLSLINIQARLRIIGVGPEENNLKKLAAKSSRFKDIQFLGAVDDDILRAELDAADCFISMDVGDFDISVVEAMGKGLRIIVANDFDFTDFGSAISGVFSVEVEPEYLANAINQIPQSEPPGVGNIRVLEGLTWEALAKLTISS